MAANTEQGAVAAARGRTRPEELKAPYVGLRPFDRSEKDIFFGRNRDAQFLSDKIFSSRLTLLYAKSGVGKSSILRTLVIPLIEDQHARVVYFDACGSADPYELLRATLIDLASTIGISDAGVGAPTLSELARLVRSADDQTLVLILDQFEEFLIAHGQRLDPLRKELAALVRAAEVDVRIVLSLRQEFLAALEPFRYEMLNLFQSTYLLDSLDDKGIRDAIEEPARLFGKTYEQELVDQLVKDLRAQELSEPASPACVPIDLPMMQLVCSQLWEAATKRETLTLNLYKEMGGAEKILDSYVREVMPKSWPEQRLTARLMKHLAPSSGFKRAYSIDDLARNEDLKSEEIQNELQRLGKHRILQSREFRGQQLWELQHDAFIRMIAPWRDHVLMRARKQRRMTTVAVWCFVIATVAVGFLWPIVRGRLEIYSHTEAPLSELKKMSETDRVRLAGMRFDMATAYLLEKGRMDLLSRLLKKYADDLPEDYGLSSTDADDTAISSEETACDSLCVHYSAARPIDPRYFYQTWGFWAHNFAEKQGIPVPSRLRLIRESSYPKSLIRFSEGTKTLAAFRMPPYDEQKEVFITSQDLQAPDKKHLQAFLDRCIQDKECRKIERPNTANMELWAVPRWSRPIWKVAGRPATDGSGFPGLLLALELQRDPTPLFTDYAFKLLQERVRQDYPQTLSEALAIRGPRLKQDLIDSVKIGAPLTDPVAVLDALAAYPEASPKQAAELAHKALMEQSVPVPSGGNLTPAAAQASPDFSSEIMNVYQGATDYLPSFGRSIQVYLGKELTALWVNKDTNEMIPEISESMSNFRANFFRQFGVRVPLVYFNHGPGTLTLQPMEFRIEIAGRSGAPASTEIIQVDRESAVTRLFAALNSVATKAKVQWILAEDSFEQRQRVEPGLRYWLQQHYSLTQQKLLMRAVVGSVTGQKEEATASAENTLRHEDWLLASLVFWSHLDDIHDGARMIDDLRMTQRARLNPVRVEGAVLAVAPEITQGIRSLGAGHIQEAEAAFARAASTNRVAAIQLFLAGYPESLGIMELQEFETVCNTQTQDSAYMWPIDLEEVLFNGRHNVSPTQGIELGLCLVREYDGSHKMQAKIEADLLQRYGNPDDWPEADARWLGLKILSDFDPFTDPSSLRQGGEELLKSAMRRLEVADSRSLLGEFAKIIKHPGPKQWRWNLLRELAQARPEIPIQFDLALQLGIRDNPENLQESLGLIRQIEETVNQGPASADSRKMLQLCRYLQALVLIESSGLGLEDRLGEAEAILQDLQNSGFSIVSIDSLMVELRLRQSRYAEAIAGLTAARKQSPNDTGLYLQMFLAQLLAGDRDGAAATAAAALEEADKLEQESRDQQLCRKYLGEMIRAALARDSAELKEAEKRFDSITGKVSEAYLRHLRIYLTAAEAGNAKNANLAWKSVEDLEQETRDSFAETLFVASLGEMMIASREPTKTEASTTVEETVRRFMETDHEYVPYIAMMLYARTTGAAQQEAQEVIEHQWKKIDRTRLSARLQGGDETAWREMLIGYYLKQVTHDEIFHQLEDEQAYAKSDLRTLPMPRQGLLCEAYFYDALLAMVEHDWARRDSDLKKVLETRVSGYIEYDLAKFLLADAKHQY